MKSNKLITGLKRRIAGLASRLPFSTNPPPQYSSHSTESKNNKSITTNPQNDSNDQEYVTIKKKIYVTGREATLQEVWQSLQDVEATLAKYRPDLADLDELDKLEAGGCIPPSMAKHFKEERKEAIEAGSSTNTKKFYNLD